jgi:hypothetical protein
MSYDDGRTSQYTAPEHPDKIQAFVDEVCKCGHTHRWHGELVVQGSKCVGITDGICGREYGGQRCPCVVFRPADKTECPCCNGTGKVKK